MRKAVAGIRLPVGGPHVTPNKTGISPLYKEL
jgi:hypothetical protein